MSENQSTAFEFYPGCPCEPCKAHFAKLKAASEPNPKHAQPFPDEWDFAPSRLPLKSDGKTAGKTAMDLRIELLEAQKARQQAEAQRDAARGNSADRTKEIAALRDCLQLLLDDNRRLLSECDQARAARDMHERTVNAQVLTVRKLRKEIDEAAQSRVRMRAKLGEALAI